MGDGKSLWDKIFGSDKKEKKEEHKKPRPRNEFAEDEKTFDGVVRQLRSDLEKDTAVGPHRPKKKK